MVSYELDDGGSLVRSLISICPIRHFFLDPVGGKPSFHLFFRHHNHTIAYRNVFVTLTAANHTLFICITVLTAVFYVLSLWAERWLRHMDRLPEDVRKRERVLDWLAIFFGTIGGIALIMLGVVRPAVVRTLFRPIWNGGTDFCLTRSSV
jgi:hypothetical protein